jgi:hypothetical protein
MTLHRALYSGSGACWYWYCYTINRNFGNKNMCMFLSVSIHYICIVFRYINQSLMTRQSLHSHPQLQVAPALNKFQILIPSLFLLKDLVFIDNALFCFVCHRQTACEKNRIIWHGHHCFQTVNIEQRCSLVVRKDRAHISCPFLFNM